MSEPPSDGAEPSANAESQQPTGRRTFRRRTLLISGAAVFAAAGCLITAGASPTTPIRSPLATLTGHTDIVGSVAFSPDGRILASGSNDKTIRLWDVATGTMVATLVGQPDVVQSVAFSPDGKTLASGSWDKTIRLWDVTTHVVVATLEGHTDFVDSVAFSPHEKTLASGSWDETIRLWDVATHKTKVILDAGHTDFVYSVAFSPKG